MRATHPGCPCQTAPAIHRRPCPNQPPIRPAAAALGTLGPEFLFPQAATASWNREEERVVRGKRRSRGEGGGRAGPHRRHRRQAKEEDVAVRCCHRRAEEGGGPAPPPWEHPVKPAPNIDVAIAALPARRRHPAASPHHGLEPLVTEPIGRPLLAVSLNSPSCLAVRRGHDAADETSV